MAGCAKPAAEDQKDSLVDQDSFDDFGLEEVEERFGVIRGVVVDDALRPLAGALVELKDTDRNATTNDEGLFAFKDVPPGLYFLQSTLAQYEAYQTSVEVVADVAEPEIVKVRLQRVPGTEPRVVIGNYDGFISCSLRIPAAGFVDGCGVFGGIGLGSTQRVELQYEGPNLLWWQGELVWDPSSPTSERLCLDVSSETHADGPVCGPSHLMQTMNRTHVEVGDLEEGESFELVTYPDHLAAGASGNLIVQQSFQFVHLAFYNFVPPEGYSFVTDGQPVLPP